MLFLEQLPLNFFALYLQDIFVIFWYKKHKVTRGKLDTDIVDVQTFVITKMKFRDVYTKHRNWKSINKHKQNK